jgi:hypothetical protein
MAGSLAGRILTRIAVLWHWSEGGDTVVYESSPRSPVAWLCPKRWLVWAAVIGGRELEIVSKIIERLAVEHGDGED